MTRDRIPGMLNLFRRHTPKCPHRNKGRDWIKCHCPIWTDGELNGERYRRSLKTRDWARAVKKLAGLAASEGKPEKPVDAAVKAFLEGHSDLARSTTRKYTRVLGHLQDLARREGINSLADFGLEALDRYRAARDICLLTWTKELHILRHFFGWCAERRWIEVNPAKQIRMPKNVRPAEVQPYSKADVVKILSACEAIGRSPYERLRARAMVLLMRYAGLRISDVTTLRKDRVRDGRIYLHTLKNGKPVRLPLHSEVRAALELLPEPRRHAAGCEYFFWSGNEGSAPAAIRGASRTLRAVFKKSGVVGAHAHRFRHTLAVEVLVNGGTAEDASDILGNSPAMIRKHYAPWCDRRQERIENLLQTVFGSGTILAQTQNRLATC